MRRKLRHKHQVPCDFHLLDGLRCSPDYDRFKRRLTISKTGTRQISGALPKFEDQLRDFLLGLAPQNASMIAANASPLALLIRILAALCQNTSTQFDETARQEIMGLLPTLLQIAAQHPAFNTDMTENLNDNLDRLGASGQLRAR